MEAHNWHYFNKNIAKKQQNCKTGPLRSKSGLAPIKQFDDPAGKSAILTAPAAFAMRAL
jgi:hypothetical protein